MATGNGTAQPDATAPGTAVRTAVAVGAAASAVFALILALVVSGWPPLASLDHDLAAWSAGAGHRRMWWRPLWALVSTVLAPWVFRIAAVLWLVGILIRRVRRGRRAPVDVPSAVFVLIAVLLGGFVPVLIKAVVERPRPSAALVAAAQTSFPSSHAFGAAVAASVVLTLVHGRPSTAGERVMRVVAGGAVVTVGAARVFLAVHYLSDVVAGVALGIAWTAVVWIVVRSAARRVSPSSRAPARSR